MVCNQGSVGASLGSTTMLAAMKSTSAKSISFSSAYAAYKTKAPKDSGAVKSISTGTSNYGASYNSFKQTMPHGNGGTSFAQGEAPHHTKSACMKRLLLLLSSTSYESPRADLLCANNKDDTLPRCVAGKHLPLRNTSRSLAFSSHVSNVNVWECSEHGSGGGWYPDDNWRQRFKWPSRHQ